jgi:hypothetical protein
MISALTLQAKSAKCFYRETSAQSKKEKEHDHVFFQHYVQGFAIMQIFGAIFNLEI